MRRFRTAMLGSEIAGCAVGGRPRNPGRFRLWGPGSRRCCSASPAFGGRLDARLLRRRAAPGEAHRGATPEPGRS